jgi:predicted Zn-dependent peptidase
MLFKEHPYHWPTIGKELSHIEEASLEQVKEFFFSHYAPNNAILSVVGNISLQKCKELVEKWYGDIPARKIIKRQLQKEPRQTELRLLEVERDVPTNLIYLVYHTPDRISPDFYLSDIISDILANGNSARLYQRLVKRDKLFVNVNAYVSGDIEEGLFYLTGYLADGVDFDTAQKALWREIEILQQERVEESELEKLKNKFESTFLLNNMDLMNLASNLAFYELLGDVNLINEEVVKYRSLTAEKIQSFAQKIFTKENCSILYYKKKNE